MEGVAVGRIVHFFDPKLDGPRAAMIVRDNGGGSVNLKVFLDTDDGAKYNDAMQWSDGDKGGYHAAIGAGGTVWATSINHKGTVSSPPSTYWDWPERA